MAFLWQQKSLNGNEWDITMTSGNQTAKNAFLETLLVGIFI
jgi:hypothetical protein